MVDLARQEKMVRLFDGGKPRVLDLFAGCGGLSLGFQSSGYDLVGSLEIDPLACESHALNFFKNAPAKQALHKQPRDITKVEPENLISELGLGKRTASAIDVIIGGPPCQAFARVGRAKLREVAAHPEAFRLDARGNLYLRYLHYVKQLRPLVLLMENVPDVLNYGGHNVPQEMCEVLAELGYICRYTLLNAVYFGVPEMRERLFLIGYAQELGLEPRFPSPTHWMELPRGYEGTRQVALKGLSANQGNLFRDCNFVPPPVVSPTLPRAVTAQEAIGDLPRITVHLEGGLRRGARRFTKGIPYPDNVELSDYALTMRRWPGFESDGLIYDHVIRSLPRDYDIFRRMQPGNQYPEAYRVALTLFEEKLERLKANGVHLEPGSPQYLQVKKETVPPYDPGKFPNKWRKMEADQPARTLMAHLGKDSYSHIHYDSSQARTISVREAARLQSFPDGFVFAGTMNSAFRQIGNAVPPLLAAALARGIMMQLRGVVDAETCAETADQVGSNALQVAL